MELKELIYEGNLIAGYYLNTNGEMFTTRFIGTNRFTSKSKQFICYGNDMRKLLGSKYGKYTMYRLSKKFTYKENLVNDNSFGVFSHRAVMETFNPFDKNLPEDLINEWENLSTNVRRYIIDGWTVDHKEDLIEGFDNLSNLQWMDRRSNSIKGNRKSIKFEKLVWN